MHTSIASSSLNTGQRGFSLVEVLVALLVLSIGLLGLAALQTTSLKYNTDSYTRTQSTILAYDIIDRMRLNPTGVSAGDYDAATSTDAASRVSTYNGCKSSASGCKCDAITADCNTTKLATFDLGKWYERLAATLPEASSNLATISRTSTNKVTITIRWKERDLPTPNTHVWEVQL